MQYRRDDMESLGYMLLYFLRGPLPWQGLLSTNQQQKEELTLVKEETISTEDLCEGLPAEFGAYLDYVRSRGYDHKPRHSYLRRLFRGLLRICVRLDDPQILDGYIMNEGRAG
jgi:hypothetical protein